MFVYSNLVANEGQNGQLLPFSAEWTSILVHVPTLRPTLVAPTHVLYRLETFVTKLKSWHCATLNELRGDFYELPRDFSELPKDFYIRSCRASGFLLYAQFYICVYER